METKEQPFAERLASLAEWLAQHPELPAVLAIDQYKCTLHAQSKDDLALCARAFGQSEKESWDNLFYVIASKRMFGFKVQAVASHNRVCEKVVTTEKVIEKRPVGEVVWEEVEVEKEVVTWKCPDSLLAEVA